MSNDNPFDESSRDYLESSIFTDGEDLDRIANWLDGCRSVLDVGAGTLHTAGYLREHGVPRSVGLDPSRSMLREGRGRYESVLPAAGRAESLPVRQGSFDGLVSRYAAHHFTEPLESLREMRRVLEPEGTLVFQDLVVPCDDQLGTIVNQIAELRDPSHQLYRSPKQWEDLLEKTGLKVLDRQQFWLSLTYEDWLNRSDPVPDARNRIESLLNQLDEQQQGRIKLTRSNGRPDTFEYPVAMFRCLPTH